MAALKIDDDRSRVSQRQLNCFGPSSVEPYPLPRLVTDLG